MFKAPVCWLFLSLSATLMLSSVISCGNNQNAWSKLTANEISDPVDDSDIQDIITPYCVQLLIPRSPVPGEGFRILSTGGSELSKVKIFVSGPNGTLESLSYKTGEEFPYWRIDTFAGTAEGDYKAVMTADKKQVSQLEFRISERKLIDRKHRVWKTIRGWDSNVETIYSAWINALFGNCDEQASWHALHEVTQNKDHNFLYDYLSMGEDDPAGKYTVKMEPDCADNPFFLRAYFAWKLGLSFGFHICDRGYVGKSPGTGQWVTNETLSSSDNQVKAFNIFLSNVMNGVHSGTARTALDNQNSDYYPVVLQRESLRPGTVFADPYGHTLVLVSWVKQTKDHPGQLLAVDAQPDKTIAVKRFWKGNFLFNTSEVVGEPGFKAFRPISFVDGNAFLLQNKELTASNGFAPFSMEQRKMESEVFYHTMERLINPKPLDPETALMDLIEALHEQLLVRVKSVANGEAYIKSHPGTIVPMPSNANGIFQAGGQWEDFSTPNRDLRLLIAMDALLSFPDRVASSPGDFKSSKSGTPEVIKNDLQRLLDKKISEITIEYNRSDGSSQVLTIAEILKRRDAFEMAYNPNDGVEIRWGAPENSGERSTCRRQAPSNQQKTMQSVRKWFHSRLHPPT
jgi:hypothetical protein